MILKRVSIDDAYTRVLGKWASVSRTLNEAARLLEEAETDMTAIADMAPQTREQARERVDALQACVAELRAVGPALNHLHQSARSRLWEQQAIGEMLDTWKREFLTWIASSENRQWIEVRKSRDMELRAYMRKSRRLIDNRDFESCLDVSHIEVRPRNAGVLTQLLPWIEANCGQLHVRWENVIASSDANQLRLRSGLMNRGYQLVPDQHGGPSCYAKRVAEHARHAEPAAVG